jgi:hypothetical protein
LGFYGVDYFSDVAHAFVAGTEFIGQANVF